MILDWGRDERGATLDTRCGSVLLNLLGVAIRETMGTCDVTTSFAQDWIG